MLSMADSALELSRPSPNLTRYFFPFPTTELSISTTLGFDFLDESGCACAVAARETLLGEGLDKILPGRSFAVAAGDALLGAGLDKISLGRALAVAAVDALLCTDLDNLFGCATLPVECSRALVKG